MPKNDDQWKVPYDEICHVRNVVGEWPLLVFTAPVRQEDIKVVKFRHVMCLN